jgi:aspartyl/asparaginyl beta-hydroxylase (cupin superfamily)
LLTLNPSGTLPASWAPIIEHAQNEVRKNYQALGDLLHERLKKVSEHNQDAARDRVDDCIAAFLGKKRIYVQQPIYMHFPRLPAIEFFDRGDFPWLSAVEMATDDIRGEVLQLVLQSKKDFSPYLTHPKDAPLQQWGELNQSDKWSALFLYKDGEEVELNTKRCPKTMAALEFVPKVQIPGRAPTAFFSLLEANTRIPPHTGVTNTRLTVHIPLIVPPNCGFRVGSQVKQWISGKALIFDDTIEHEAWNSSNESRVIMIFDIWNPLLTVAEQEYIAAATAGIAEYYADDPSIGNMSG